MGYMLSSNLTYCEIDDQLIFLDLQADRYFRLQDTVEVEFRRLASGQPSEATRLASVEMGLVHEIAGHDRPAPCAAGAPPSVSLLDCAPCASSPGVLLAALARLAFVRRTLRRGGLSRLLEVLRREKERQASLTDVPEATMAALASDFERTARLTRSHDQCLPRAIALTGMALRRGIAAELVIGVQLRPFAAHAWVRCGSVLLNERVDMARTYTPILVL